MTDAANLRLASTVAGVIIIVVAGVVACSVLSPKRESPWWVTILGAVVSLAIVYVGFEVIRSGNFMAYYN